MLIRYLKIGIIVTISQTGNLSVPNYKITKFPLYN